VELVVVKIAQAQVKPFHFSAALTPLRHRGVSGFSGFAAKIMIAPCDSVALE